MKLATILRGPQYLPRVADIPHTDKKETRIDIQTDTQTHKQKHVETNTGRLKTDTGRNGKKKQTERDKKETEIETEKHAQTDRQDRQ